MLPGRTGLCPANQTEPLTAIILPYFVRSFSYASAKTCYVLAVAQATIVLPAFARSYSVDGEKNMYLKCCVILRNEESDLQ